MSTARKLTVYFKDEQNVNLMVSKAEVIQSGKSKRNCPSIHGRTIH